ncbi:alkaline phosphatase [Aeromicrobium sp.]|uniref:alkaline phosphatase n=1 Tax=Aeromicrobium sp. TaxID=1871063 RepID=UPI003C52850A
MNTHMRINSRRSVAGAAVAAALVGASAAGAIGVGQDLSSTGGAARLSGDQSKSIEAAVDSSRADNVILFIGDGMGDSEITSARNYAHGAAGRLPGIDALPLTGQYTTYSLTKAGKPDYVPDSAATGTAWATGTKSYDGAIGVDIRGRAHANLFELAKKRGLKTGNVSTAEIQDATPAVLAAHISSRSCKGPAATSKSCSAEALENGGPGSISEQIVAARPDVSLGGGAAYFDEKAKAGTYGDSTVREQAEQRGFQTPTTADELARIERADSRRPVLGLFARNNFAVNLSGPAATSDGATKPPAKCTPNSAKPSSQPTLEGMTSKAISLLDKGNKKGFFLQVEAASIDKQDHAANACGQIGEAIDLDQAVQAAMTFAKRDKHTLVIVTADHGHTSQIVETGTNTPGLTATLLTADDSPMTLSYGTAPEGGSQEHTGTQVRIAGYGPQAGNVVGLTDQTDLFFTIARALKLEK